MNITSKQFNDTRDSLLSMVIILLGIIMVVFLIYYVFLPFSEMIADQIQSQNSRIYFSSI